LDPDEEETPHEQEVKLSERDRELADEEELREQGEPVTVVPTPAAAASNRAPPAPPTASAPKGDRTTTGSYAKEYDQMLLSVSSLTDEHLVKELSSSEVPAVGKSKLESMTPEERTDLVKMLAAFKVNAKRARHPRIKPLSDAIPDKFNVPEGEKIRDKMIKIRDALANMWSAPGNSK
jgi:hypothetical protein